MKDLNRQLAERMGYKVVEANEFMGAPDGCKPAYVLLDPKGKLVGGWFKTPKACWENVPAFDTWAGVGLVLEWLGEKRQNFEITYADEDGKSYCSVWNGKLYGGACVARSAESFTDFPRAICEYALEVTKEAPPCPTT